MHKEPRERDWDWEPVRTGREVDRWNEESAVGKWDWLDKETGAGMRRVRIQRVKGKFLKRY